MWPDAEENFGGGFMRRTLLLSVTILLAAGLASFVAVSVDAQAASDQYTEDTPPAPETAGGNTGSGAPPPEPLSSVEGRPSQGSIVKGPGLPEESFPAYSQVIDNGSSARFKAPGWVTKSSAPYYYGKDYSVTGKGSNPARYKVKVPATDVYSVYAWWTAEGGNDPVARYGVSTTSGTRWTEVDQQRDGGLWVKLGEYKMRKGDRYAVQVTPGSGSESGATVADAVAVVRGVQSAPPEEATGDSAARSGDATTFSTRASTSPNGYDVVRQARRFIGKRYRYATCTTTYMSCTCLTKKGYGPFGVRLPMTESGQWNYTPSVRVAKSNLRPGDEVFFKEGGSRYITHVGIYSGGGNIVHASSYFGKVIESKMMYISGYYGAKKYRLR